jgi:hypothetical protein
MSYATEIEVTKVLNVEVTFIENKASGTYREILIESENGNLRIKLYANSDKAEIQVLI